MRPDPDEPVAEGVDCIPPQIITALVLLRRACEVARQLRLDSWQFAVGLPELLALGLNGTEVRWLLACGLVEHALERVNPETKSRSFRRMANLALTARTCLVLTPAGERLLERWEARQVPAANGSTLVIPHWDGERRQLWYREQLVKWYRARALSQETILAAFEEEGWPPRIDDPLGRGNGCDPRVRLHEAVKGLNRGQMRRLLVFRRDGSGEGVTWAERRGQ
jgi:hypothetical protein